MKTVWCFLKKKEMELTYDSAIILLGTPSKELRLIFQRDICKPIFITALLITVKRQKQPKPPLTYEWISKYGIYIQWDIIQP